MTPKIRRIRRGIRIALLGRAYRVLDAISRRLAWERSQFQASATMTEPPAWGESRAMQERVTK